jgi:SAM-dependent methyltransferase
VTHWTDGYYGDLYLDTVADLLSPRLSALEAEVIASLLALGPRHRVLDLACGTGRHAWPMAGRVGSLVGIERSQDYLARANFAGGAQKAPPVPPLAPGQPHPAAPALATPTFIRGDLRALPFGAGTFDAAYSWYSSLFMYDDASNLAVLREAARPLRPAGRLLVHHANPLALALEPEAVAMRTLPDGSRVEERSSFDPTAGVDRCARRLVRPDGRVLEGTAELRYYTPAGWEALAAEAGLRLRCVTSTAPPASGALGPEAPDLIALLESP